MTESVPIPMQARRLTAEQHDDVQKKLDEVKRSLEAVSIVLQDIQALLTPCYGEHGEERCVLPDHHRGRHLSDAGTEWFDAE